MNSFFFYYVISYNFNLLLLIKNNNNNNNIITKTIFKALLNIARTKRATKKAQDTRIANPNNIFDPIALANALDKVTTATLLLALGYTPIKVYARIKIYILNVILIY